MKIYTDFATKPGFLHYNRLDDVTIRFERFLDSPFKFPQSNKDTLKQLFEKIKEKKNHTGFLQSACEHVEATPVFLPGFL